MADRRKTPDKRNGGRKNGPSPSPRSETSSKTTRRYSHVRNGATTDVAITRSSSDKDEDVCELTEDFDTNMQIFRVRVDQASLRIIAIREELIKLQLYIEEIMYLKDAESKIRKQLSLAYRHLSELIKDLVEQETHMNSIRKKLETYDDRQHERVVKALQLERLRKRREEDLLQFPDAPVLKLLEENDPDPNAELIQKAAMSKNNNCQALPPSPTTSEASMQEQPPELFKIFDVPSPPTLRFQKFNIENTRPGDFKKYLEQISNDKGASTSGHMELRIHNNSNSMSESLQFEMDAVGTQSSVPSYASVLQSNRSNTPFELVPRPLIHSEEVEGGFVKVTEASSPDISADGRSCRGKWAPIYDPKKNPFDKPK